MTGEAHRFRTRLNQFKKEFNVSILSQVSTGRIQKPYLLVLHGPPGVGKTTFASQAPNPLFLGAEDGTSNLDTSRLPQLNSFSEVKAAISELITEAHQFKTLVIDSLDWLEPLIWKQVCTSHKVDNIEEIGYGKGYVAALTLWSELIVLLKDLREKRSMNIIAIAHSHIKNITDPSTQQSYDRFILKLNDKASALWREFVDAIFFCTFDTVTKEDKQGKTKAYSTGERIIFTEWRPGMDAKNRYALPFKMPLSFEAFHAHVSAGFGPSAGELVLSILEMAKGLGDEKVYKSVLDATEKNKTDAAQLTKIKTKLEMLLTTKGDK